MNKSSKVILIMGGNEGNVLRNFEKVLSKLQKLGENLKCSSIYKSRAWGMVDSEDFYNQAIMMYTAESPASLMTELLMIEKKIGRKRTLNENYQDRPIDIDILFYNSLIIDNPDLTIPHPRLHLRNFVMIPLLELIPEFVHPVYNKTIRELHQSSADESKVYKI